MQSVEWNLGIFHDFLWFWFSGKYSCTAKSDEVDQRWFVGARVAHVTTEVELTPVEEGRELKGKQTKNKNKSRKIKQNENLNLVPKF